MSGEPEKRILSWDVGIKNLAYCLMTKEENDFEIEDWGLINLVDDRQKCRFTLRGGNQCQECAKFTIYHKGKVKLFKNFEDGFGYVCKRHKEKMIPDLIDLSEKKKPKKSKKSKESTISEENEECVCCVDKCKEISIYKLNGTVYSWCEKHYENKGKTFLKKIGTKKYTQVICTKQPLMNLSEKLFTKLDELHSHFLDVEEVLIENQPVFKNPTMKTIATVLYSYYVMRGIIDKEKTNSTITNIKFVSALNKLKVNSSNTEDVLKSKDEKKAYGLRKELGEKYCKALINKKDDKILCKEKKKDDMCDAFLQGFQHLFNPVPEKYFKKLMTVGFKEDKKKTIKKVIKKKKDCSSGSESELESESEN
jgi:hypothetical protein